VLDTLKDTGSDFRLMTFRRAIDHPNFIALAPQLLTHLLEARSIQKAGYGNIAYDPG
jgi:hypothetical protein